MSTSGITNENQEKLLPIVDPLQELKASIHWIFLPNVFLKRNLKNWQSFAYHSGFCVILVKLLNIILNLII